MIYEVSSLIALALGVGYLMKSFMLDNDKMPDYFNIIGLILLLIAVAYNMINPKDWLIYSALYIIAFDVFIILLLSKYKSKNWNK